MAKSQFPMMKSGGSGVLPKVVGTLVLLAVLAMVVKHPVESAHGFSAALAGLGSVAEAFSTFLSQVG